MRIRHVIATGSLALVSASCSLGEPEDAGSINLFVSVNDATLGFGETMTITVTAKNVGVDPVSMTGPSDCLLFVEVLNNQGQVVWHTNGTCVGATVIEELGSGEEISLSFTWQGENLAGARLSAGFYHIRPVARLSTAPYAGPPLSVALE